MAYRLAALAVLCAATPALAQEAPTSPFTIAGSVGLVSDYRFRGVSQSDEEMAVQGGITVSHESGAYAGVWGSNLAGWGTFGGANMELDLIGGFKLPVGGGGTLDVGLTWYTYPGGASETDFAEPYVKLSGTAGPVSLLAGVAYAPKQQALGKWYATGGDAVAGVYTDPGDKEDNLYLWGDATAAITTTPVTLKGHIGYSRGNSGLGPNGTSVAPTGEYWDWMLGADYALGKIVLGVAYVDTDIGKRESAYLVPNFSSTKDGGSIAGSQVVFSITAAF
ncbi:TorF family putative porin [uncultured Sphingomonas sp.]|uniref:TorF family putative porin n=1 Tax=uncultured Sphingomonas sp. TaxID=158754 RepID=UPI0025EC9821|nr:TorF family putative porin [uncultured Sphingomonas sp.]